MNSLISRGDVQVQAMEQTLKAAERHLGEICSILASYTRKTAKLRDKADQLVAQLFDFSRSEDSELQIGLKNLAEDLAMVQDYRQAQVERLETKVVAPLKTYEDRIKNKRTDLKKISADLNREQKELQKLERIRQRSPGDRQSIAELNVQKASTSAQGSIRQLEETITDFQRHKLEDIKNIFLNFITVEMHFYAKTLEVYTQTYCNLEAMNIQKDLEVFSGRIKASPARPLDRPLSSTSSPPLNHYSSFAPPSSKAQGLSSMEASNTGQSHRQQANQQQGSTKRPQSNLQRQAGTEEELEQEDEEEEESETEIEHSSRQSYAARYVQMRRWQI